jgi:hypothetical protein
MEQLIVLSRYCLFMYIWDFKFKIFIFFWEILLGLPIY